MVYIDIKNSRDKTNITNLLRSLNLDCEEIESKSNLTKNQIIITDNNLKQVKDYRKLSSKVIVYNKTKDPLIDEIYYKRGVYVYCVLNELEVILKMFIKEQKNNQKRMKVVGIFLLVLLGTYAIGASIHTMRNSFQKKPEKVVIEEEPIDPMKKENIVFFGDSITAMYDVEEYYKGLPVVNSGTSGNTTEDLLRSIDERVYIYNPTQVFLLIGTNDISATDLTNKEIVENIKAIVEGIKTNRKNATIYVESIFPIRNTENTPTDLLHQRENSRIMAINDLIKKMCEEENIEYIDLYHKLLAEDGELNMDYSLEGVHMNPEGYKVITKELKKYIEKNI